MPEERERLRATFDAAAPRYDEARPGYPEELFEEVIRLARVPDGGRLLEVGCGTGQATEPFARRGYEILCVELGENLAAGARRNLAPYPRVEVRTGDFETVPLPGGAFDLLFSATAFHWLDPAVAYPRAAEVLRPGGAIALFWNEHVRTEADDGFFRRAQAVYKREAPEIWDGHHEDPPRPEDLPDRGAEIEGFGLFGPVTGRGYRWDRAYDTAGYLRVLDTYSGHLSLADETRQRHYEGLRRLIEAEYGGHIVKGYQTTLYVARKL
jgi:SAM-dependent methyltransferase